MSAVADNETYGEVEGDMEDGGGEDNIRFITQVGRTYGYTWALKSLPIK